MIKPAGFFLPALLSLLSSSVLAQAPELGLTGAAAVPPLELPVSLPAPELPGDLLRLRAEAAADPARFIDERTPFEVSRAFGLLPDRYLVTDPARISSATVRITIYLSRQKVNVQAPDFDDTFPISSGLPPEFTTPGSGNCYAPDFIEEMHYSSLYSSAPMPTSIFFNGNIALHGTLAEHQLGRPASHGCVRMARAHARQVYDLVKKYGRRKAVICLRGKTPGS